MSNGRPRPQHVQPTPTQGSPSVMGEMGRPRGKYKAPAGMRAVQIFKGTRDNFDDMVQVYLDEDGPFKGQIADETHNKVTVIYPEKAFRDHQAQAESKAMRRVAAAAAVDGATSNTVTLGPTQTMEALVADAEADAAKRQIQEQRDATLETFDQ